LKKKYLKPPSRRFAGTVGFWESRETFYPDEAIENEEENNNENKK
jgi:hypothetical protein